MSDKEIGALRPADDRAVVNGAASVSAVPASVPSADYSDKSSAQRAKMLAALSQAIDTFAEFVADPVRRSEHDARLLALMLSEFTRLSGWIAQHAAQAIERKDAPTPNPEPNHE